MEPVIARMFWTGSPFGRAIKGVDTDALVAMVRELIEERPRTRAELRPLLEERWPDDDSDAMSAIGYLLPVVQVPPRGVWGQSGQATWTTAESWLGRPLEPEPSIDDLVMRYFAGYGPAAVMDIQAWCGLTKLREVVDRLGPGLRVFRDEAGRELFDVPDAPRPDPDTPAPVRFLPEYDNALLGYKDRTRMIGIEARRRLDSDILGNFSTFLVDGFVAGRWKLARERSTATITLEPVVRLSASDANEPDRRGRAAAWRSSSPDAGARDVRISRATGKRSRSDEDADARVERDRGRRDRARLHADELGVRRRRVRDRVDRGDPPSPRPGRHAAGHVRRLRPVHERGARGTRARRPTGASRAGDQGRPGRRPERRLPAATTTRDPSTSARRSTGRSAGSGRT